MCGIVGYIGTMPAGTIIMEGLRNVAYRGYDSAGIATRNAEGKIELRRREGAIEPFGLLLERDPLAGTIGIGHTRWATHGKPYKRNAHPHVAGKVAVVHNGIIENFADLRRELQESGCQFASETDTEVIPHLINRHLENGDDPINAVRHAIARLKGSFALAILFEGRDRFLIAVRVGSPLVIGFGSHGSIVGSDPLAIVGVAKRFARMEDGDVAVVTDTGATIYDRHGIAVERTTRPMTAKNVSIDKDGYRHFMAKEIHQQPEAVKNTLRQLIDPATNRIATPPLPFDITGLSRLKIVACGTAYHAGLVAKHWFEELAGIPVECDVASEFLYRESPIVPGEAALFISQSGETADTIAALTLMKAKKVPTLAIVNVPGSTLAEAADGAILTTAWPEIAVASTKAFTAQLAILACLAIATARARNRLTPEREAELIRALMELPEKIKEVLALEGAFKEIAEDFAFREQNPYGKNSCYFYVGRGTNYPIALEGALKLKEVAYLHADAYAAGELKHGPLALIESRVPTIAIAPRDRWFEKTALNLEEIFVRGGKIILLSDADGCRRLEHKEWTASWRSIALPTVDPLLNPIIYAVAVQLLAYHLAAIKGTEIDRPRNLAKSVTVE
jgi:glucosamine--fructose-6-phosphate aminotransferase (isomerizing)